MKPARSYPRLAFKVLLCIGFTCVLLGLSVHEAAAQNTKGDRPEVRSSTNRENRFKISRKKSQSKGSYNRIRSRRPSPANSARVSKPTKAGRNFYSRGTAGGRSVSEKAGRQSRGSSPGTRSASSQISKQNTRPGRISPRSASARNLAAYSKRNRAGRTRSTYQSRSRGANVFSNRQQVSRAQRFGTKQSPSNARISAAPRSVSKPFIARKSTTPFARFWNQKPKGEKPYVKGDLAGRPLRTKNFQSQNPVLTNPTARPYRVKPSKNDRLYKGPITGGYVSRSQPGKPWRGGDIAGRKIKGRNYVSKTPAPGSKRINPPRSASRMGTPYRGTLGSGGARSVSGKMQMGGSGSNARSLGAGGWNNRGRAIAGRNTGANGGLGRYAGNVKPRRAFSPQGEMFTGNIKRGRRLQGGGSISGAWNNNGRAIAGRNAGTNSGMARYTGNVKSKRPFAPQGETYSGNIKRGRQFQGGGSISGAWNNHGRAIAGRNAGANSGMARYAGNVKSKRPFSPQGETYSGNIKRRRPLSGGGSISGAWNNNGQAIARRNAGANAGFARYTGNVKPRKPYSPQGETFTGNIKANRRQQGGGSISGSWNNRGQAVAGRYPGGNGKVSNHTGYKMFQLKPSMRPQGEEFTGAMKARPKPKGGGSVSGTLWNNKEQAITVRNRESNRLAMFPGNLKAKKNQKKDVDYFPGKHKPFDLYPSMRDQGEEFTGNIKLSRFKRNYLKNPNAADESLKKARPDRTTYLVNGLQVKVKEKDYKKKPHGAEGALPGIAPGKNSIQASEYSRVIRRRWDYTHNPSSARAALRTREPSKAFLQATSYQGNIKMKRFDVFSKKDLYPDSRFVKTNKNNTDGERGALTNFKLWWARLFKKNENQPDHLKEKIRKPRYDKGEQGLWYD